MSSKQSIIQDIHDRIRISENPNCKLWTIGLTHDPATRKEQHKNDGKNTKFWRNWTADSLSDAEEIESYFINEKEMKGGTGGDLSPRKTAFVYIF